MLISLLAALAILVWTVAVVGWLETRRLWNGGTCEKNGQSWHVVDTGDGLYLFAGPVGRKINWPIVYGKILDQARTS